MPRPVNPHTQRLTLYLRPELAQQLDKQAAADGCSLNDVMRAALLAYLKKHSAKL